MSSVSTVVARGIGSDPWLAITFRTAFHSSPRSSHLLILLKPEVEVQYLLVSSWNQCPPWPKSFRSHRFIGSIVTKTLIWALVIPYNIHCIFHHDLPSAWVVTSQSQSQRFPNPKLANGNIPAGPSSLAGRVNPFHHGQSLLVFDAAQAEPSTPFVFFANFWRSGLNGMEMEHTLVLSHFNWQQYVRKSLTDKPLDDLIGQRDGQQSMTYY